MNNINDIRIDIKPSNVQIYEQVLVMSLINQTNQEKYEAVKPVADKLNLYCDTHCIKCIEDCNFLSISFDKIQYAEYDKEDNILMIVLKKVQIFIYLILTLKFILYMYIRNIIIV